ncbi:MAG: chemotaxis protein CheC [Candidatus Omnitrophota bacterium]
MNKFNKNQRDILREVGNICAGNAAVALAQILFKKIELQVPTLKSVPLVKLASTIDKDGIPIIGIQMETLGMINSQILLLFSQESAYQLMELLVGSPKMQKTKLITQIGISSLKEIGNIVISAYVSTLSAMSKLPVYLSCPQFTDGVPEMVIKSVFGTSKKQNPNVILIETYFNEFTNSVKGKFFIAFDPNSMRLILKACKAFAKSMKKS